MQWEQGKIKYRKKDWKNDYSIFSKDSQVCSNSARLHYLFANHLIQSVKLHLVDDSKKPQYLKTAAVELNESLRLYPGYYEPIFELAEYYGMMSQDSMAIITYEKALAQLPEDPKVGNNLANVYSKLDKYDKAIPLLNNVLPYCSDTFGAHCLVAE